MLLELVGSLLHCLVDSEQECLEFVQGCHDYFADWILDEFPYESHGEYGTIHMKTLVTLPSDAIS